MMNTYEKRGNAKFGFAVWVTTPGWNGGSSKVADAVNEKWADKLVAALRAQEAN